MTLTIVLSTRARGGAHEDVPSGRTICLRPPRPATVSGTCTVMVSGFLVTGVIMVRLPCSLRRLSVPADGAEIGNKAGQPLCAQPDDKAVGGKIYPLDHQMDGARLLDREQFLPDRIEPFQRSASPALLARSVSLQREFPTASHHVASRERNRQ